MNDEHFKTKLADLETALETPQLAGELESWSQDVHSRAQAFHEALNYRLEARHESALHEIDSADAELIPRTEQLRGEDEAIAATYDDFLKETRALPARAKGVEPDEAALRGDVEKLCDTGLALVIRIRKQELAVKTWGVESVTRDRGVKD